MFQKPKAWKEGLGLLAAGIFSGVILWLAVSNGEAPWPLIPVLVAISGLILILVGEGTIRND